MKKIENPVKILADTLKLILHTMSEPSNYISSTSYLEREESRNGRFSSEMLRSDGLESSLGELDQGMRRRRGVSAQNSKQQLTDNESGC